LKIWVFPARSCLLSSQTGGAQWMIWLSFDP